MEDMEEVVINFATLVKKMREQQRRFFANKKAVNLAFVKQVERAVDEIVEMILKPPSLPFADQQPSAGPYAEGR